MRQRRLSSRSSSTLRLVLRLRSRSLLRCGYLALHLCHYGSGKKVALCQEVVVLVLIRFVNLTDLLYTKFVSRRVTGEILMDATQCIWSFPAHNPHTSYRQTSSFQKSHKHHSLLGGKTGMIPSINDPVSFKCI